jgi:vancomycin resistance protein YoaR
MAQVIPGSASQFQFTVTFYISPVGTWRMDVVSTTDWSDRVSQPVASGTADMSLTVDQERLIREVVQQLTEVGISRMVMPF